MKDLAPDDVDDVSELIDDLIDWIEKRCKETDINIVATTLISLAASILYCNRPEEWDEKDILKYIISTAQGGIHFKRDEEK